MGQRRPIQVAAQTCLQFLNRDGVWPTQEPLRRFSTRITPGFLNSANEWMKVASHVSFWAVGAIWDCGESLVHSNFLLIFRSASWLLLIYSILQGGNERIFLSLHTKHTPVPVRCNWIVFARQTRSTTEFAMTVLSKRARDNIV